MSKTKDQLIENHNNSLISKITHQAEELVKLSEMPINEWLERLNRTNK